MPHCTLCNSNDAAAFEVAPKYDTVMLCATCRDGAVTGPDDGPHWRYLTDAIWSQDPPVQVIAYRLLKSLPEAPWARETLEIAHLEPEVLAWAEAGADAPAELVHRDSNGAVLAAGDTVVLIKDLPVKGAGFTAKRGTAVRGISLVADNAAHIEGRVEGQRIVILTQYVKKS